MPSRNDLDTYQAGRFVPWPAVLYGRYGVVSGFLTETDLLLAGCAVAILFTVVFPVKSLADQADSRYGFQTTTKLRMVLSVALVDAMIKDADIVAVSRNVPS